MYFKAKEKQRCIKKVVSGNLFFSFLWGKDKNSLLPKETHTVTPTSEEIFIFSSFFLVPADPPEKTTFTLLNTPPIKEGDKVEMKCETDGNPQPLFDFSKDVCK